MTVATSTTLVDQLAASVAAGPDPAGRVEALLLALSGVIKSTSNDQNVQRLSRELRAAAADLARAASEPTAA